ncbi:hypothetical protein RCL1_006434 [Eukaryota sp. TZLM3-RCL]
MAPKRTRRSGSTTTTTSDAPKPTPKRPRPKVDPDDPSRKTAGMSFSPADDIAIKEAIETGETFASLAQSGKLSAPFPTSILQQRWKALLTDPEFVKHASAAMMSSMSLGKRAKWTDLEEKLLREGVAHNFISFSDILEKNRSKFHPTRTPKSLEAHYYKMKRSGNLPAAVPMSSISSATNAEPSSSLMSTALDIESGNVIAEQTVVEDSMPAAVILNLEHYTKPIPEFLGYTYPPALLVGRVSHFQISSSVTFIGRSTKGGPKVDIDVSKEACVGSVSRRQAVIVIDDGKFSIKNLGKNPIVVNGNAVLSEEMVDLEDRSLLEFSFARFILFIYPDNFDNISVYDASVTTSTPSMTIKQEEDQGFDVDDMDGED